MVKTRTIAAVCGLMTLAGALTVTRAQQSQPRAEASPRKTLRDKVVRLRAQGEVRRLELDAARQSLLDDMKTLGQSQPPWLEVLKARASNGDKRSVEAVRNVMKAKDDDERQSVLNEAAKRIADEMHASVAHRKEEFTRLAVELNETLLDLEEAEARYRQIR